jgi:sugar lactone lactonase YvrE
MEVNRVGDFSLGWGESLVWDDRRKRLYFVDCATQRLHWIDDGADELGTLQAPSMPAGIVPTEDGRLVGALDDGLYVIDADAATFDALSPYPSELGGRANDAAADLHGNLVTGTLNLMPAEGSAWWYSNTLGWRLLDPDITNTNGPAVVELDGVMTLIVGDTASHYFAYDYDPTNGAVGTRRVFGNVDELEGGPDGSTVDDEGGLWCALYGGGQLVRFTTGGLDRAVPVPVADPTDVTFGGPDRDRLYVTSVAGDGALDGALIVIDGLGARGRVEPRFALS